MLYVFQGLKVKVKSSFWKKIRNFIKYSGVINKNTATKKTKLLSSTEEVFMKNVNWPFSAWCPLKGHTYLNKPAAFRVKCKGLNVT